MTAKTTPHEMREAFAIFARAAVAALSKHSAPLAKDIAQAFAQNAEVQKLREADSGGVLSHFPVAAADLRATLNECMNSASADSSPLFAAAARLSSYLFWRAAGNDNALVAATELIGPSGLVACARFRTGLFFQPAQMFYAWHRHAAEEIYLPLCGTAEWYAENRPSIIVPPLQSVHHPSWIPHAMQTFDSPLCALWGWRGDIAIESYELCAAPSG